VSFLKSVLRMGKDLSYFIVTQRTADHDLRFRYCIKNDFSWWGSVQLRNFTPRSSLSISNFSPTLCADQRTTPQSYLRPYSIRLASKVCI